MMSVHVVLSVYNGVEYTLGVLGQLEDQSIRPGSITVVDGGSTDGTPDRVAAAYPHVDLVRGDKELWWTQGMSLGVERVLRRSRPGDLILAINNDVHLQGTRFLEEMVNASISRGRALTGCICRYKTPDGPTEASGGRIDWRRGRLLHSNWMPLEPGADAIEGLDFLCSRATLIPEEVFRIVGNYDARSYPHNLGDMALSYRAALAGFRLIVTCRARLEHLHRPASTKLDQWLISYHDAREMLTSMRSYYRLEDNLRFIRDHCPRPWQAKNERMFLLRALANSYGRTFPLCFVMGLPLRAVTRWLRAAHGRSVDMSISA